MKNLLLIIPTVLILTVSIIRIYQTMYGIQIHQWQQFVYWISWGSLWTTIYHIVCIEWKEEKPVWKISEQGHPSPPACPKFPKGGEVIIPKNHEQKTQSLMDKFENYVDPSMAERVRSWNIVAKDFGLTKERIQEAIDEMRDSIREIKNESSDINLDDDIIDRPFKNNL